jgi:hypothetical protein
MAVAPRWQPWYPPLKTAQPKRIPWTSRLQDGIISGISANPYGAFIFSPNHGALMSYELSDTERNAALQLNADYRYDHFISKVAQHQLLWVLKGDKGLLLLESEGDVCLPLWPHPDYAQAWIKDELASYELQSITLEIFLKRWAEGLEQDGIAVAVFPLPDESGLVEDASELAATLEEKLEQLDQPQA